MKLFGGKVLFLDRNDINTDEIIPAVHLSGDTKDALKPFLLEDLKLEGFDHRRDIAGKGALVTRANFGCGSSREHAPWVLEVNGINIVIAESFARIFRQNMYNCGMIACELPPETLNAIFEEFAGLDTDLTVQTEVPGVQEHGLFCFRAGTKEKTVPFTLGGFERALVTAGGWIRYALERYP